MRSVWQLEIRMEEVGRLQGLLEGSLREAGFSADLVHDLSLVSEEMLVNTVSYGQPSLLEVSLEVDEERRVTLAFKDDGIAFNPLEAEERDPDDERLGGWGIPMLRALTDEVRYDRVEPYNVLTVRRAERDS